MVPLATIPPQTAIFIFSLTGNFCNALLDRVSEDKPLSGNRSGEPKADLGGLSVNGRKFRDAAFAIHHTSIDYFFPLLRVMAHNSGSKVRCLTPSQTNQPGTSVQKSRACKCRKPFRTRTRASGRLHHCAELPISEIIHPVDYRKK
jgi:hypothetical protein